MDTPAQPPEPAPRGPRGLATCGLLLATLATALPACRTALEHREDADREVYEIIRGLRDGLAGGEEFSIEPIETPLRERLLAGETLSGPIGLITSLQVASENSRDFQNRRESLYLSALDLTLARWDFSVKETGTFGSFLSGGANAPTTAGGDSSLRLTKLFATGLSVIGDLSFNLVRDVSRGDAWTATSNAGLSITQPLLRGFGRDIVLEPLTQAERDVVYEARSYDRFRRTFAFDAASRYYRILEQVDVLENERQNQSRRAELRVRNEAFAEAGLLDDIQVDQASQDELSARNRVIDAQRSLSSLLDSFKLFLGLPIETELSLDESDRPNLDTYDALDVEFTEEAVIAVALASRLDYLTALDRVDDVERRVRIAADDLRAALDLGVDVNVASEVDRPFRYDRDSFDTLLSLSLDTPLERVRERNAYRERLIDLDQAIRSAEEAADTIRAELRDSLRNLDAARESYQIQSGAVVLAQRRVESAQLKLEAGRADTRDVLDSQDDLVAAQNAATNALTDYILAGLALYVDMELVRVDETGFRIDTEPLLRRIQGELP